MKGYTIRLHLRDSIDGLKRNKTQSLMALIVTSIMLFVLGTAFVVQQNYNKASTDIVQNVRLRVMFDQKATPKEREDLKTKLEGTANVVSAKYSSQKDEYHRYVKLYGKSAGVYNEDKNPLYPVFNLKVKNTSRIADTANVVKKFPKVVDAQYGGSDTESLVSGAHNVGVVVMITVAISLLATIITIYTTIKQMISSRGTNIEIMKLQGATNGFVRTPFIFEGIWLGLFGALFSWLALIGIYGVIYGKVNPGLLNSSYSLVAPVHMGLQLFIVLMLVGLVVGIIAAGLSANKYLKEETALAKTNYAKAFK